MPGLDNDDERWLTRLETPLGISFVIVFILLIVILEAVYYSLITVESGSLLISSLLTLATFGYVLLTFDMSQSMREEMRLQRKQTKLKRKPEVMEALAEEALPLYNDVMNVKGAMSGTGIVQIDDEWYQAYPYIPTEFEDPMSVPRLLQSPIDINPGDAHDFYTTYQEYRQVYGTAVVELERLILSELDSLPSSQTHLRELAMLALQLDTEQVGSSGIAWDSKKGDIIPLRREIPELIHKLGELRHQMKNDGTELATDLGDAINNAMQEYEIDGSQLDTDPVSTEWADDDTGQTGIYIGSLPHQPGFADPISVNDEDSGSEETDEIQGKDATESEVSEDQ